ncbi:unnamed protein product [Acanthoscelides obtectus]|uniref:Uncharacterized protein n=1 Tax=Acanthoscelides obtectus TaxID=200917 RepID=A0A9P0M5D9_ACAOB|nr:unnamed protein product [Acanthoscelides obtectus]CAK1626971.1 hypothetical protein AOBTE_LOCUS4183 [Acanthoscelides obtectus]
MMGYIMGCSCFKEPKKDKTDGSSQNGGGGGALSPNRETTQGIENSAMVATIGKPERPSSLGHGHGKLTRRLLCYHSEHFSGMDQHQQEGQQQQQHHPMGGVCVPPPLPPPSQTSTGQGGGVGPANSLMLSELPEPPIPVSEIGPIPPPPMFSSPSPVPPPSQTTAHQLPAGGAAPGRMSPPPPPPPNNNAASGDYDYEENDEEDDDEDPSDTSDFCEHHLHHHHQQAGGDESPYGTCFRMTQPDPAIDTTRIDEIPAKEPKFGAVPLKSALKKKGGVGSGPGTPTQEHAASTATGGPGGARNNMLTAANARQHEFNSSFK